MVSAALVAGMVLLSLEPAAAHTGFESSDPADGTTIGRPVDRIVLRFSGPAEPAGEGFVVLDPSRAIRQPDAITGDEDRQVWTLEFDPPLTGGAVGVRWTVQAPDAHPIDGSFRFTVTAPSLPDEPLDDVAAGPLAVESGTVAGTSDQQESEPGEPAPQANGDQGPQAQDLDVFLALSDNRAPYAKHLGAGGRLLGLAAAMVSIGGVVFAATVVQHRRRDAYSVLRWVRVGGAVVVIGAAVELVAQLAIIGNDWNALAMANALEPTVIAPFGVAVGLRALAGVVLFAAATTQAEMIRRLAVVAARQRAAVPVAATTQLSQLTPTHVGSEAPPIETLAYSNPPGSADVQQVPVSAGLVLGVLGLLVSFAFDGHTVSEGRRWVTAIVDIVHVAAGAVWAGGVIAMAGVLWSRYRRGVRLYALELAVRFSVIAAVALVAAGIAGTVLAVIILDSPMELWSTAWGRLLIIKFLAVVGAAGLGAFNHFMVIPWMNDDPLDDSRSLWLRNMVTTEAVVLALVIAVTALLVGAAS